MSMIPPRTIDEVRMRSDIVEVISRYIPLKKAGANYRALCPFHEEKTPSFNVSPARQIFHCFGCGEGGNAITFVMKHESVSFPEAVRVLADQCGIEIKTTPDKAEGARERIYRAMEAACAFYQKRLKSEESSSPVKEYLKKRGVTDELVKTFMIGWAPEEWEALTGHLLESGFDRTTLESAGLSKPSSKGNLIDRFRGRLIFPIFSFGGKTIAFGARLIDDDQKQAPKYINSPETSVYSKRSVLYGLNLAKSAARRENSLIVVEGYMDTLALRLAGIDNCAAVSGTAFTSRQAEAIRRVCENVIVLFDTDEAGVTAAKKSVPILLDIGLKVKALSLPGAKDPDEFIKARGKEKFLELMSKAPPFPLFIIDAALSGAKLGSVEGKTRAVREAIPFLRRIQDNIERSQYVQILAERAGIDVKTLQAEVGSRPKEQIKASRAGTPGKKNRAQFMAEKILLRILLENLEYLESHASELSVDDFKNQDHRDIYTLILEAKDKGLSATADIVNLAYDDTLRKNLTELSLEMNLFDEKDIEQVVSDCASLVLYSPEARRRTLKEQATAAKLGESEKFIEAKKKYMESRRRRV